MGSCVTGVTGTRLLFYYNSTLNKTVSVFLFIESVCEIRKVLEGGFFFFLRSQTHLRGVKGFPLQDLLPSLLVILVVNSDDVVHVFLTNILLLPLPPRRERLVTRAKHY